MNIIQESLRSIKRSNDVKTRGVTTKPARVGNSVIGQPLRPISTSGRTNTFVTPKINRTTTCSGQPVSSSVRTKSSSSHSASNVVVAVCEGRGEARGVVGLAAIDIYQPILLLCQITDTQTYKSTLTKINVMGPTEVLVPSTFIESAAPNRLFTVLTNHFPTLTVTSVSRADFNRSRGMNYVTSLCAQQFRPVTHVVRLKFYALAAACALLRYIEQVRRVLYTPRSIKVEYQEPEDTVLIDIDTMDRLQLISSYGDDVRKRPISLLSLLDRCVTGVGRRLLRANILQPLCKQDAIEARLDCVQELIGNPEFLANLRDVLVSLANIEHSLLYGTLVPASAAAVSERQLNYTLQLKSLLQTVPVLQEVLEGAYHPVFRQIHDHLCEDVNSQQQIMKLIAAIIHEDAHPAKGHAGVLQRCFAIRSGLNDFLDVARRTYTETIDDMRVYVEELTTSHSLPLRIHYNVKMGFHIMLTITKAYRNMKSTDLPHVFIRVVKHSNHFSMTTQEMIHFDQQLKNNSQEIQSISNVIIYNLLVDIRPLIGHLYQLCDDVALLDVLVSLAQVSAAQQGYVRPNFSTFYTELTAVRHPFIENTMHSVFTANSIVLSEVLRMHVITGPNMAGKSVFLHSICLVQVMAQVGCYVPARHAAFRICQHMYARTSAEDSLEDGGMSSFGLEMHEMQHVLNTITDSSLIVLDEFCQTTACDEGASMAAAIFERLLTTKAFVCVATHFFLLTKLADLYPQITNWHFEAVEELRANNTRNSLQFTHKLLPGVTTIESYGIKLSRIANRIESISDRAEALLECLQPLFKPISKSEINQAAFLKFRFEADLQLLKAKGQLTPECYKKRIEEFQKITGINFDAVNAWSPIKSANSATIPNQDNNNKLSNSSSSNQGPSSSQQLKNIHEPFCTQRSNFHESRSVDLSEYARGSNTKFSDSNSSANIFSCVKSNETEEIESQNIYSINGAASGHEFSSSASFSSKSDPLNYILKSTSSKKNSFHPQVEQNTPGFDTRSKLSDRSYNSLSSFSGAETDKEKIQVGDSEEKFNSYRLNPFLRQISINLSKHKQGFERNSSISDSTLQQNQTQQQISLYSSTSKPESKEGNASFELEGEKIQQPEFQRNNSSCSDDIKKENIQYEKRPGSYRSTDCSSRTEMEEETIQKEKSAIISMPLHEFQSNKSIDSTSRADMKEKPEFMWNNVSHKTVDSSIRAARKEEKTQQEKNLDCAKSYRPSDSSFREKERKICHSVARLKQSDAESNFSTKAEKKLGRSDVAESEHSDSENSSSLFSVISRTMYHSAASGAESERSDAENPYLIFPRDKTVANLKQNSEEMLFLTHSDVNKVERKKSASFSEVSLTGTEIHPSSSSFTNLAETTIRHSANANLKENEREKSSSAVTELRQSKGGKFSSSQAELKHLSSADMKVSNTERLSADSCSEQSDVEKSQVNISGINLRELGIHKSKQTISVCNSNYKGEKNHHSPEKILSSSGKSLDVPGFNTDDLKVHQSVVTEMNQNDEEQFVPQSNSSSDYQQPFSHLDKLKRSSYNIPNVSAITTKVRHSVTAELHHNDVEKSNISSSDYQHFSHFNKLHTSSFSIPELITVDSKVHPLHVSNSDYQHSLSHLDKLGLSASQSNRKIVQPSHISASHPKSNEPSVVLPRIVSDLYSDSSDDNDNNDSTKIVDQGSLSEVHNNIENNKENSSFILYEEEFGNLNQFITSTPISSFKLAFDPIPYSNTTKQRPSDFRCSLVPTDPTKKSSTESDEIFPSFCSFPPTGPADLSLLKTTSTDSTNDLKSVLNRLKLNISLTKDRFDKKKPETEISRSKQYNDSSSKSSKSSEDSSPSRKRRSSAQESELEEWMRSIAAAAAKRTSDHLPQEIQTKVPSKRSKMHLGESELIARIRWDDTNKTPKKQTTKWTKAKPRKKLGIPLYSGKSDKVLESSGQPSTSNYDVLRQDRIFQEDTDPLLLSSAETSSKY